MQSLLQRAQLAEDGPTLQVGIDGIPDAPQMLIDRRGPGMRKKLFSDRRALPDLARHSGLSVLAPGAAAITSRVVYGSYIGSISPENLIWPCCTGVTWLMLL